jgi:hypothetical protein
MRARSKLLSGATQAKAVGKVAVVARMAPADRKAMILTRATEFFAEYGLTAQTRALAAACGVAQMKCTSRPSLRRSRRCGWSG